MIFLAIVAHPNKKSFSHAIAVTCARQLTENGHEAVVHDLYEENFNPLLPYDEFQRETALPIEV